MSLRFRGAWTLVCAAAMAGCWNSDEIVKPAPTNVDDADVDPAGPLGNALPVDGRIALEGLSAPVDIVRDPTGTIHIYAQSQEDAFRAQGYAMARDRAVQLELLRRTAFGRVAEILGDDSPQTIDQDIVMRTLGLRNVAEQEWDAMLPTLRPWVAAFADGVSQHFARIADGTQPVPPSGSAFLPSHFEPFSPVDVLAIDKLMQFAMSWSIGQEMRASRLVSAARTAAKSEEEPLKRRAGMLPDLMRFAPPRSATTLDDGAFGSASFPSSGSRDLGRWRGLTARHLALSPAFDAWDRAAGRIGKRGQVGSNAWAVSPSRSASGGSLLAVDAHYRLSSPAALWMVHMQITDASGDPSGPYLVGASLPGLPGVAYGFHRDLAWSPVASYFDVADLYVEQLDGAGSGVSFRGSVVPLDVRQETIRVAGGPDVIIDVRVVPHHGPLVPVVKEHQVAPLDPEAGALSVRWGGLVPSRDLEASLSFLACHGVEQALAAVGAAPSLTRSYVFADPHDVLYVGPMGIIDRDEQAFAWDATRYEGVLPCLALPGDGSAEWTGARAMGNVPYVRNPASAFVVSANADPVGGTLDNDPSNDVHADGTQAFLSCSFDAGFRQGRIQDRLSTTVEPMGLVDAASVQADVRSDFAARLVPHLIEALERTERERDDPGTFPRLSDVASSQRFAEANPNAQVEMFRAWGEQTDFRTLTGVTFADMGLTSDDRETLASRATLVFHAWLIHLLDRVFSDELSAIDPGTLPDGMLIRSLLYLLDRQPSALASFDPELGDSILWDDLSTPVLESRDERLVTALLDAIDWLGDRLGDDVDLWRWGLLHTVRFAPFAPSMATLSIPSVSDPTFPNGFPRPGGLFTVDTAGFDPTPPSVAGEPDFTFTEGPALRMAVTFEPSGPSATAALAGGQIADPSRANFSDGAEYWRHNATQSLVYRRDDVIALSRLREVAWSAHDVGSTDAVIGSVKEPAAH